MLDVMATHITIAGLSSSLCEHQLATKLSFYHLLAHIVGVSFTRPLELFPNNHGSLGHADVQPWQNKHRNYYRPLKITPSEHKCSLYTVETVYASLAPWTGNKHRFPVVCDHIVRGPRCFQLSNQTKQLLKANVRNPLREESFHVHSLVICQGFSQCSPSRLGERRLRDGKSVQVEERHGEAFQDLTRFWTLSTGYPVGRCSVLYI